jgi:uroporphyrinogen decarboxylase
MTSRERVLAAIRHTEPDRLPIDCGAMRSTGIQAIAYGRLKRHLGMDGEPPRVFDVIQQLAEPEAAYLDRFGIDAINAGREFSPDRWKPWTLPDGQPCLVPAHIEFRRDGEDWLACNPQGRPAARMVAGTTYFSQIVWPMADDGWFDRLDQVGDVMGQVCWAALSEPIYADGLSDANLARIRAHLVQLRQTQDRAIMIALGANLFEWATFLRGMDHFLMDLAAEPARVEALLDKLVETHLATIDRLLPAVGEHIDLIQLGDDLGMESGPFFSPQQLRELFKPRYRIIIQRIKRHAPHVVIFLHSCGSIAAVLDDLIDAGVEVINPVQISAHGMEPAELKRRFGPAVTFWGGGCDTQTILPRGTPQQVKDHVRRNIDILAPGGGFVFNQVHNILSEVPPENVVAMYEAARE